jgi:hypothetical protein
MDSKDKNIELLEKYKEIFTDLVEKGKLEWVCDICGINLTPIFISKLVGGVIFEINSDYDVSIRINGEYGGYIESKWLSPFRKVVKKAISQARNQELMKNEIGMKEYYEEQNELLESKLEVIDLLR